MLLVTSIRRKIAHGCVLGNRLGGDVIVRTERTISGELTLRFAVLTPDGRLKPAGDIEFSQQILDMHFDGGIADI